MTANTAAAALRLIFMSAVILKLLFAAERYETNSDT